MTNQHRVTLFKIVIVGWCMITTSCLVLDCGGCVGEALWSRRRQEMVWSRGNDGFENSYFKPKGEGPTYVRRMRLRARCVFGDFPEDKEPSLTDVACGAIWKSSVGPFEIRCECDPDFIFPALEPCEPELARVLEVESCVTWFSKHCTPPMDIRVSGEVRKMLSGIEKDCAVRSSTAPGRSVLNYWLKPPFDPETGGAVIGSLSRAPEDTPPGTVTTIPCGMCGGLLHPIDGGWRLDSPSSPLDAQLDGTQ